MSTKIEEQELKIFYSGGLNTGLDQAIEKCLKRFGYKRWASGMDLETGTRNLAFDKEEN